MMLCAAPGCTKQASRRQYCPAHYARWCRYGDPLGRPQIDPPKICTIPGCGRKHRGRGYCGLHHNRWLRHGDPLALVATPHGVFAAFVEAATTYSGSDCLLWPASQGRGYSGALTISGKRVRAHRIVCERVHGAPPSPELEVAHSCNNRACLNPAHLRWDTHKGNEADKFIHGTDSRGERNGNARLSAADVVAIRASPLPGRNLVARYGVSLGCISAVRRYASWEWVEPSPADVVIPGNRGERNGITKLTTAMVLAVLASPRSNKALAELYGVDPSTISNIRHRKSWRWLEPQGGIAPAAVHSEPVAALAHHVRTDTCLPAVFGVDQRPDVEPRMRAYFDDLHTLAAHEQGES